LRQVYNFHIAIAAADTADVADVADERGFDAVELKLSVDEKGG
jgi:hypothetical protein